MECVQRSLMPGDAVGARKLREFPSGVFCDPQPAAIGSLAAASVSDSLIGLPAVADTSIYVRAVAML